MSLIPLGKLEIRGGVKTIVTSNDARAARSPMIQHLSHQIQEHHMARATGNIRVRLFDGPHHGRILLIPAGQRVLVLPNPMPAGEMFAEGRSRPQEFSHLREVTYELRTPKDGGDPYLSWVETPKVAYQIPQPKPVYTPISSRARTLISAAIDAGYNYHISTNGSTNERRRALLNARYELAEYVSKLERESYPSQMQHSRVERDSF